MTNKLQLVLFFEVLLLIVSCEVPAKPEPASTTLSPSVLLGGPTSLEGSWVEITTGPASGGGTVKTTLTYTFNGSAFSAVQVNQYSDGRPDQTYSQTGTALFQASDATVTIHETTEFYNGAGPNTIDKTMIFRNALVDGVWHPSTWIRIGTGKGIGGTWETPKYGTSKTRYTFDPTTGTVLAKLYNLDGSDMITGLPTATSSNQYLWDGSTLSFTSPSSTTSCKLLAEQLLEIPLGSSTRSPVFNKQ